MNNVERFDIDECGAVSHDPEGQYTDADVTQELYDVLNLISRRLQMDIDDGSRPDQWSMESLVFNANNAMRKARGES